MCVLRFRKNQLPPSTRFVDLSMVQALIRQLLTAKAWVRFQVSKYTSRICSGQISTGTSPRTSPSTLVFASHYYSTYIPYSSIHLSRATESGFGPLSNGVKKREEVRKQSRQCSKQDGRWAQVPSKGQTVPNYLWYYRERQKHIQHLGSPVPGRRIQVNCRRQSICY